MVARLLGWLVVLVVVVVVPLHGTAAPFEIYRRYRQFPDGFLPLQVDAQIDDERKYHIWTLR